MVDNGASGGAKGLQEITATLQAIKEQELATSADDLLRAADALKTIVPDNYEAWRAQADLWFTAVRRLQVREIAPDENITLMGIPLREEDLRNAAEKALRQCAHFAPTVERRIALIDEANSVRAITWF